MRGGVEATADGELATTAVEGGCSGDPNGPDGVFSLVHQLAVCPLAAGAVSADFGPSTACMGVIRVLQACLWGEGLQPSLG